MFVPFTYLLVSLWINETIRRQLCLLEHNQINFQESVTSRPPLLVMAFMHTIAIFTSYVECIQVITLNIVKVFIVMMYVFTSRWPNWWFCHSCPKKSAISTKLFCIPLYMHHYHHFLGKTIIQLIHRPCDRELLINSMSRDENYLHQ